MTIGSSTITAAPPSFVNRMEIRAAEALLGVSPEVPASDSSPQETTRAHGFTISPSPALSESSSSGFQNTSLVDDRPNDGSAIPLTDNDSECTAEETLQPPTTGRPRSNSASLDALAILAESEAARFQLNEPLAPFIMSTSPSTSSDDDSEAMPPPPPRRRRSASNPEGVEKWDSLGARSSNGSRRHFVLPESILEEELAEARTAMEAQQSRPHSIPEESEYIDPPEDIIEEEFEEEEEDISDLTPAERLQRARSKLLEDLCEENSSGDKGIVALPHSLGKYKTVSRQSGNTIVSGVLPGWIIVSLQSQLYNKNGRIGIYTPDERAAVIERFKSKRGRRVWNKKIRYGCRKNLADRRLRIKGRFVKREEQEELARKIKLKDKEERIINTESTTVRDENMPDVTDPEAGFSPTEEQPFRRVRRHTIT